MSTSVNKERAAVFRTKTLHVYGFDSIRILFQRGEISQHTGNSPGNPTRRISVCNRSAQNVAAHLGVEIEYPRGQVFSPVRGVSHGQYYYILQTILLYTDNSTIIIIIIFLLLLLLRTLLLLLLLLIILFLRRAACHMARLSRSPEPRALASPPPA